MRKRRKAIPDNAKQQLPGCHIYSAPEELLQFQLPIIVPKWDADFSYFLDDPQSQAELFFEFIGIFKSRARFFRGKRLTLHSNKSLEPRLSRFLKQFTLTPERLFFAN